MGVWGKKTFPPSKHFTKRRVLAATTSLVGTAGYSFSKPWLVNFRVRLFSVTVRTTWSDAPEGM